VFGGLKLWKQAPGTISISYTVEPFNRKQWITLTGILVFAILVFFFKVDVGFCAVAIAGILSILGVAEDSEVIKKISWGPIMMVCGVSLLMDATGKTGGLELFTSIIASVSNQSTITAVLGFVTGVISVYASSSGVVMPTFIPLVPSLIAKMGGGDPIALVSSINLGAHLVDASPVSPGGAMCLAAAAAWVDKEKAFRQLMIWGLSMSVVGALVCWLLFTVLKV
jgi:di/tricarboxylate transporter